MLDQQSVLSESDFRKMALEVLESSSIFLSKNPYGDFYHHKKRFVSTLSHDCIGFKTAIAPIDVEPELKQTMEIVKRAIKAIDASLQNDFTFAKMWETDKEYALYEIDGVLGGGLSFWHGYDGEQFGQPDRPSSVLADPSDNQEILDLAASVLRKLDAYLRG